MRLWHQSLIPYLDNKRLLGQHRECCALRGNGWGKKHSTVNYVFKHDYRDLYYYHRKVMNEMYARDYMPDENWLIMRYRGKHAAAFANPNLIYEPGIRSDIIYPEHDDAYLRECLLNLKSKGAELVNGKSVEQMLIELDLKPIVE